MTPIYHISRISDGSFSLFSHSTRKGGQAMMDVFDNKYKAEFRGEK